MKTGAIIFILRSLVLITYLPTYLLTTQTQEDIPEEIKQAVGRVIVNTTACSVTCGPGYKEQTDCEVGPDGVRRDCKVQRLECLTNWICGMLHFTIFQGEKFELNCLSSGILESGQKGFRFTWKLARGIISINDELFKPFKANSPFLLFIPAYEYNSGTYRCDVELLRNLKIVKRLYFGLRVLSPDLVKLNFQESLTENQKLIDEGWEVNLDNESKPHLPVWQKKVTSALGIGIAAGVVGGVLVSVVVFRVLGGSRNLSSL